MIARVEQPTTIPFVEQPALAKPSEPDQTRAPRAESSPDEPPDHRPEDADVYSRVQSVLSKARMIAARYEEPSASSPSEMAKLVEEMGRIAEPGIGQDTKLAEDWINVALGVMQLMLQNMGAENDEKGLPSAPGKLSIVA